MLITPAWIPLALAIFMAERICSENALGVSLVEQREQPCHGLH
jgi:hypothetical protein